MDRFTLQLLIKEYLFEDEQQNRYEVPWLRLTTVVYVGTSKTPHDGLIDTGSPLTVFPEKTWKDTAGEIRWLSPAPGSQIPSWLTTITGVTGGSPVPCRLG